MKSILVLATTFLASAAVACPNLAGDFMCEDPEGDFVMTVEQSVQNGVTTYSFDGDSFIADGMSRPYYSDEGDGLVLDGTSLASCVGNTAKFNLVANINDQGQTVGNLDITSEMSLDASGNLYMNTKGSVQYGGQKDVVSQSGTCVRM